MADQLQLRGAGETGSNAFTGAERELTVDVTNWNLRLHDGVTPGGHVISGDGDNHSHAPAQNTAFTIPTSYINWNSHLIPNTDSALDIGSASYKVRHLYVSDNSIKFENGTLGVQNGNLKYNGDELTASFAVINSLNARLEALENQSNLILE